jgi:alkanesulfonate monooxygenase SsuD/methylene tetrahydromethanopterin reductase-like flavin-dependent oxidoreductase (luciferase family)
MRLFTVGVGALPGEAEAVGVDFASRGRRADEAIEVLRLLWSGGADGVSHHGEFFDFERLCSYPKPVDVAELPIHVGGSSRAAARRAGRLGGGFFPGGALSDEERAIQWELAKATAAEAGHDPATLQHIRWGSLEMKEEQVEKLAKQGVTRIVVGTPDGDLEEQCAELSAFAERFGLRAG